MTAGDLDNTTRRLKKESCHLWTDVRETEAHFVEQKINTSDLAFSSGQRLLLIDNGHTAEICRTPWKNLISKQKDEQVSLTRTRI